MTRTQFADAVILNLGYNDQDKKLDRRQVYIDMDIYLPQILTKYAQINGEEVLNNFLTSSVETVKYDTGFDRFFVDIPKPMNLGGFAGVRQIGDTQDESFAYVPVQSSFNYLASNLEVGGMADRAQFYLLGNRAYFKNPPAPMPDKVRITRVPTIASLTDIQEITCPAEVMSFLSDKLKDLLEEEKQTPQDNINNTTG